MEQLNRVELIGRVGMVRKEGDVVKFQMATNFKYLSAEGLPVIETTWHTVVATDCWPRIGDYVHVVGRIRKQKYTTPNGQDKIEVEIYARRVEWIDNAPSFIEDESDDR